MRTVKQSDGVEGETSGDKHKQKQREGGEFMLLNMYGHISLLIVLQRCSTWQLVLTLTCSHFPF